MVKIEKEIKFYVDCSNRFEAKLLKLLLSAYEKGTTDKNTRLYVEDFDMSDDEPIGYIIGDVESKAILDEFIANINDTLAVHDKNVAGSAIAKYKKEHNITD